MTPIIRKPRRARAFGLLEVMVSAGLLAVGMAAIMSLVSNLEDNYRHQRIVAQALHIGEATLEDLLVRYADDADLTIGAHTGPGFTAGGKPGGIFFATSWNVVDGVPFAGTREVTVTIQWNENGIVKQMKLTTVRT
jgi:hypothetical protein